MNTYKVYEAKDHFIITNAASEREIITRYYGKGWALPLAIELVEAA